MRTALIIVDMQPDFMKGGPLEVSESQEIIHPLELAAKEVNLVIVSRDWHPDDHMSFKEQGGPYPSHCVQDTKGAKIIPRIKRLADYTISKGMNPDLEAFSAFVGTTLRPKITLEEILQKHEIERIFVGGLALDVCVRYTALDASALGYLTIVMLDCTRAISHSEEVKTFAEFERAGVLVQTMTGES